MKGAIPEKQQLVSSGHTALGPRWVLLVGATAALLAVNLYLLWAGYMPLHFSWHTLADPALSQRMLAPAEWLESHLPYLHSMVPLPIDGNPPVPVTIAEPETWLA